MLNPVVVRVLTCEVYTVKDYVACRVDSRINRFVVRAYIEDTHETVDVHINNTGKLTGVLRRDARGYCYPIRGSKLSYRLFSVEYHGGFAVIDTGLQELSFASAVEAGMIPWLRDCRVKTRAPRIGRHRLDYLLSCIGEELLVETKSAVLADSEGYALYPDTPSLRGRKHVELLLSLAREGRKVLLLFIAAFPNAKGFKPNRQIDPVLARLVSEAAKAGVNVKSIGLMFEPAGGRIILYNPDMPVLLD